MQRKVKFVLGLIIAFLVIIDVTQIAWLYTNYQDEKKQYESLLTNLIGEATFRYQLKNISATGRQSTTFYIVSGGDELTYKVKGDSSNKKLSFTSKNISFDSIEGGLGHSQLIQMQTRKTFDINQFDTIFKKLLVENDINIPYILNIEQSPQQTKKSKAEPISHEDSLVPTKAIYPVKHKDYPIRTASMLINTYGDTFIYASFKPYPQFALKKMIWPLISSLLIFIIINAAFVYVLKTIRQQKKINEIKNDFINNMTHELRTPITIATSAIDSILNHHGLDDKKKTQFYLETSKGELLHLDHLVEKILNIAIEDKKDLELSYESVNIKNLISTIIDNHTLIATKDVQFHFKADDANIKLNADKLHLANALNNIIDNAIKYSNNPVNIYINCSIKNEFAVIVIKDNGIGIAKEYLSEIFNPFFRVPHGNLHDVKGFGLGLSYVKKIVEKHGGTVQAESNLNEGSLFILSIPLNPTNA